MWFRSSLALFILSLLAFIALDAAQGVALSQSQQVITDESTRLYYVRLDEGRGLIALWRRSDNITMYREMARVLTISLGGITAATGLRELVAKLWRRKRKRPIPDTNRGG